MSAWPFSVAERRGLGWLPGYLTTPDRRGAPRLGTPVHLLLCVADHFEPMLGDAPPARQRERVRRWVEGYPKLFGGFRDSDGRPPRHSFFYPAEEYEPEHLDAVAGLCRAGFGEVEVHLHHDNDTAENLRRTLTEFRDLLVARHGQLARHRRTGAPAYGFIHGDWALDNSRPDRRCCGVDNELDVLRETGCYADFTLPSFPSPCQTRTVNGIYYAVGRPGRSKSHDSGVPVGADRPPGRGLMMVQGPLVLDWDRRKWGLVPRVENGCLQGNQPPSARRLGLWLSARVRVPARPDWYFVKLHTHGADEKNMPVLLGEPMARFHEHLAGRAAADPNFRYHYVTAREVANLVRAAEAGWAGPVAAARDFEWAWQGAPAGQAAAATTAAAAG
jgi:hypothetical protein